MLSKHQSLTWALLLWLPTGAAFGQQLKFSLMDKTIILERIRQSLPKNQQREEKIKEIFDSVGCGPAMMEQPVKHVSTPNVICRLPGESDDEIIVGAHYDKVSAGTGTVDNWSGAALLPSLYQGLASIKRRHTFVFIAFTGEEEDLLGSDFFVHHMSHDEIARTRAMVNMDTLGLSFTKVWVHRADKDLLHVLLMVAASMKLPVGEVDVEEVGSTDSESFADKHIPRITIHSVTQDTLRVLHSSADNLQALRPDDYYETYRLIQAYLAYLDQKLPYSASKNPSDGKP